MELTKPELRRLALDLPSSRSQTPDFAELINFVAKHLRQDNYLASYCAFGSEIDTEEVNRSLPRVVLPAINGESKSLIWRQGSPDTTSSLGFKQPSKHSNEVSISEIGLVLVPGLLFANNGARLGRGGGYYDRFLAELDPSVPTIGMVMSAEHLVSDVPVEKHDLTVSHLFVEDRIRVVETEARN